MVLIHLSCNIHFISILIAAILYQIFRQASAPKRTDLVIGILSKRGNFERRNVIRKTWMRYVDHIESHENKKIEAFFIVGKQCPIPNDYRQDQYTCEPLKLYPDKDLADEIHIQSMSQNTSTVQIKYYPGISFEVRFPIIITKLGVLCSTLTKNDTKIYLTDARDERVLSEQTITDYETVDQFCYVKLHQQVHLPKGFIAAVKINATAAEMDRCELCPKWDTQTSLLKPLMIYHDFDGYDTSTFTDWEALPVSFTFKLADPDSYDLLRSNMNESYDKFRENWKITDQLLDAEAKSGDVVILDVIDTYRNLTEKLVSFMKWLEGGRKYDYFLKTDDDSYLDLISIAEDLGRKEFGEKTWWGNFRRNWAVNMYGKWADPDYSSPIYPAFACGAGYLFSYDIVSWILKNAANLHRFQGEDVSMGIWLSAILPNYENDDRWFCDEKDDLEADKYSIGQLSINGMFDAFHHKNIRKRYVLQNT